jgi:hypothetical protein
MNRAREQLNVRLLACSTVAAGRLQVRRTI